MKTTSVSRKPVKKNQNTIIEGVHTKYQYIMVDNHNEGKFVNLISLDSSYPNRVEERKTANNPKEYKVLPETKLITIHND